jgi:hypothetical protein
MRVAKIARPTMSDTVGSHARPGVAVFVVTAAVICGLARPVAAQHVYAASVGNTIVALDPSTGAQSVVASGVTYSAGISTFDVAGRRLLFTGCCLPAVLWSLNVDTSVLTQIPLSNGYSFIEFVGGPFSIPALSHLELALLLLILSAFALLRLRTI